MMDRRQFLGAGVRAGAALGIAKALTNTVVGYGQFGLGDNVVDDPPAEVARERMPARLSFRHRLDGWELNGREDRIDVRPIGGTWDSVDAADAPESVVDLVDRLDDIRTDRFSFAFLALPDFFEFIEANTPRPNVVAVLRGWGGPTPRSETVESFAGVDPRDVAPLVEGLAEGFARTTRYDTERYLAGAIEDNVLPVEADLRARFRPQYSFEVLSEEDPTALFCGEYTLLANRAFRVADPHNQHPPVAGLRVVNRRHKHVHNGLASAVDTDDGLVVPIAFVDYTYTTLYADLGLEPLLGNGLDAYDRRHRADRIWW